MSYKSTLIEIGLSSRTTPTAPFRKQGDGETRDMVQYRVLVQNPYFYDYESFLHKVHVDERGKKNLKLDTYKLEACELAKRWGWCIHADEEGRLALVGYGSDKYNALLKDESIEQKQAYKS